MTAATTKTASRRRKAKPAEAQPELLAAPPAQEPLPAPLAHAIWLHQVVFEQLSRSDSGWWIWYERHAAYCEEIDRSEYRHEYMRYRQLYRNASYAIPGARRDLEAILARMPDTKASLRLALLACEDVIDSAREELDRAEEFVTLVGRMLSAEAEESP